MNGKRILTFIKCFFSIFLLVPMMVGAQGTGADDYLGQRKWMARIHSLDDEGVDSQIIDAISPELSSDEGSFSRENFIKNFGDVQFPEVVENSALIVAMVEDPDSENVAVGENSCERFASDEIAFVVNEFKKHVSVVKCMWIDPTNIPQEDDDLEIDNSEDDTYEVGLIRSQIKRSRSIAAIRDIKFHKVDRVMGVVAAIRDGLLTGATLYYSNIAPLGSFAFISTVVASMTGSYLLGAYWQDVERFYQGKLLKKGDIEVDTKSLKLKAGANPPSKLKSVVDFVKFSARKSLIYFTFDGVRKFLTSPATFFTQDALISILKKRFFGMIGHPVGFVENKSLFAGYISPTLLKWIREFNNWVGGALAMSILFEVQEITLGPISASPEALMWTLTGVNALGQFVNYYIGEAKFKRFFGKIKGDIALTDAHKAAIVKLAKVTHVGPEQLKVDDIHSYSLLMEQIVGSKDIQKNAEIFGQMRSIEVNYISDGQQKGFGFLERFRKFFLGKRYKCNAGMTPERGLNN